MEINNIVYTNIIYTNKKNEITNKTIINYTNEFLSNEDVSKYILKNEEITNYIYNFKIGYYSKIFKHSDIYGVYPNTNKILQDYNFIKNITINDGSPFGKFTSKNLITKIYYIKYKLYIKKYIIITIMIMIIFIIFKYFIIKYNNKYTSFIEYSLYISFILATIQFWIFYPGYMFNPDIWVSIFEAVENNYTNANPFIIAKFLHVMYHFFGYNTYYVLILNLILWYSSLNIIIIGLYIKYNNKFIILLYLISFLYNIYIMNITHLRDSTSSLILFLAISIIIFQTLVYNKYNNKIFTIILMLTSIILLIISMFWRHNFIVSIYPIFTIYAYKFLIKNNSRKYILRYITYMIIIAIFLISIYKVVPYLFLGKNGNNTRTELTYHLFYLQIFGMAYYSDDYSIIPQNWYYNNINSNDLKNLYINNNSYADIFPIYINKNNTKNVSQIWIKYIIKHPLSYLKHIIPFTKKMWIQKPYKLGVYYIQNEITKSSNWISENSKYKLFNITKIRFSNIRKNIYKYIILNFIDFNTIYYILVSFIILITSLSFLKKYKNELLIISTSISLSSIMTALIVALFSPVIHFRYIYPVIPITIIALISFITFLYDEIIAKNKN